MTADDDRGPFPPPRQNVEVSCVRCGDIFESYQLEWRPDPDPTSGYDGHWHCPTPGCVARGFCFEIFPTDPDYEDDEGNVVWTYEYDDDGEYDDLPDDDPPPANGSPPPRPAGDGANDDDLPW